MMKAKNRVAKIINGIYFVLSIYFLVLFLKQVDGYYKVFKINFKLLALIIVTAIVVNTIKALRLYIVLFGKNFKFLEFVKQYIITTIVNSLLPFKSGEIYRGYCMGNLIGSITDGYIIMLFDRFVDTLALITLVFGCKIFSNIKLTSIYLALAIFLVILILVYILFKPLYQYWNHFLIFNKSSKHTLVGLEFLKTCNKGFENISAIVKGRFVILYVLSFVAWGVEIGAVIGKGAGANGISIYLTDILVGNYNADNIMYTMVCLILFSVIGVVLFLYRKVKEKEYAKANNI